MSTGSLEVVLVLDLSAPLPDLKDAPDTQHDDEADVPDEDEFADPDDIADAYDEMNRRHQDRWDEEQAVVEEGPLPDFDSAFDIAELAGGAS